MEKIGNDDEDFVHILFIFGGEFDILTYKETWLHFVVVFIRYTLLYILYLPCEWFLCVMSMAM